MSSINWLPLESNPECLKSFGVPEKWGISDIISLDEEFIDMIPTPSLALLLLFPTTPKYLEYCEKLEELHKDKEENIEDVYYMKQTIRNACGTVALLHAIANNENKLNLESGTVIKKFFDSTKDLSPEEKGKLLEQNVDISAVHESSAQQGQTEAPNLDDDVNLHFIAIVNVNGKLVELDGRKFGPLVHGTTSEETFLKEPWSYAHVQEMRRQLFRLAVLHLFSSSNST